MKTPPRRSRFIVLGLFLLASLASDAAATTDYVYVWKGGSGNWADNSDWDNTSGSGFDPYTDTVDEGTVYIDGGKTSVASKVIVTGFSPGNDGTPNNWGATDLIIDAGDTLTLYSWFNVTTITNNGSLVMEGDGPTKAEGGTGDGFQINSRLPSFDVDLEGTGVYTMTADDEYICCYDNGHGFLTIGKGTLVQGRGNIGDQNSTILNSGTISGNDPTGALVIQPGDHTGKSTKTLTNTSTAVVQATDGGTLALDGKAGGTFTGGTFQVIGDSSFEFNNGATISNATMATQGTGKFSITGNLALTGITLTGHIDVVNGLSFDGKITSTGLITDEDYLTFPNGLDNEGGTVDIANGAMFAVTGNLANDGLIELENGSELSYTGSPTLSGTGILQLKGSAATVQGPNQSGNERLTIAAGLTVEGVGNLLGDDGTCTNGGLVNANVSGGILNIEPDPSADFTNTGSGYAEATGGGVLQLYGGTFAGNSFRALDGSKITLYDGPVVTGATLSTSGTGVVNITTNATLNNVTLNGTLNAGIDNTGGTCILTGTLTNNGTLSVQSGSIQLNDAVTLAGTGTIIFTGENSGLTGNTGLTLAQERLTIGAGQTIQGGGGLGENRTTFTNLGLVNANVSGAEMTILPDTGGGDFTNSGNGRAEATNGGVLELSGALFTGGSFEAEEGSFLVLDNNAQLVKTTLGSSGTGYVAVADASVNDVSFSGQMFFYPGSQLQVVGPFTNNGTLTLGSAASGGNAPGESTIYVQNNAVLTNTAAGAIRGLGTINCAVVNQGVIATEFGGAGGLDLAGPSVNNTGTLAVGDDTTLTQDSSSTLTNYDATTQTLKGGTYHVDAGTHTTTLSLNIGTVAVNDATVILSGVNSVFTPISGLSDNEGSFSLLAQRQFTTAGALTNSGTLALDAGSTLHVAGALTTTATSTLSFTVGGTATSGAKSPGVLQASGKATLAGNLIVTFASSASLPAYTDTFTIFSAPSAPGGSFANVANGARIDTADGKGSFQVSYGASSSANAPTQIVLSHFSTQLASVITSPKTVAGTQGKAFSYQVTASNSPTKYGASGLQDGLSINATTGVISGTPTAGARFTVTLFAYNAVGHSSAALSVTIAAVAPAVTSADMATAQVGQAFSYQIKATNGPTSFGVGGLRPGLSVDAKTGLITGTPQGAGTFTLVLRAANAAGTGSLDLTLTIKPSTPQITSSGTATATVGQAFSYQIEAPGSPTAYGATGLFGDFTVNRDTGLITGTPTASEAGTHVLTLQAANAGGTGTKTLTLTVTN